MPEPFSTGYAILGAAGINAASSFIGARQAKSAAESGVRLGGAQDHKFYKKRDTYDWRKAMKRGLTPQEYYGSPAAGNNPTSGATTTLGNQFGQAEQQKYQQIGQAAQNAASNQTSMNIAQLQSDTSIETAKISAGASRFGATTSAEASMYSTDIKNALATKNYQLVKQRLTQVEIPKLLAQLKISSQQFKKLTNEIATSTPAFTLYMKKLSMGVDNMMVEFLQHSYGINITDPKSVQSMSPEQKAKFIQHTAGITSHAFKEAAGITLGVKSRSTSIFNDLSQAFNYSDSPNKTKSGKQNNTQRATQAREYNFRSKDARRTNPY